MRFLPALADAGVDLVFLPAESTVLLYETIFAAREHRLKVGLCLALGTSLGLLPAVLPMIDAVLLLGRVTSEGHRGRDFNRLVVERVREVRRMIDAGGFSVDLQAAGGLETDNCVEVCKAGATSLPIGAALHREAEMRLFVSHLKQQLGECLEHEESQGKDHPIASSRSISASNGLQTTTTDIGTKTFNVLVASRSFGKHCPEVLDAMKAAGCVFLSNGFDRAPTEEELVTQIPEADVLISGTEPVTARVLAAARRLKVISKHGVGHENIDVAAAKARGIPVTIAGGTIGDSVADMAMALLLALARQIPQGNSSVKTGAWGRFVGPELRGKILGLVGLGQIGKGVCRRAKGFGMELIAYDTYPDRSFSASWGVSYVSLEELLKQADFVSLHLPVAPETRQLFNSERLGIMKRDAFLINTARGELVDEGALFEALTGGRLAGAASDVFSKEPPGNNPLLRLENFIAMPHSAGQTPEGLRRMGEVTAENALRVLRGEEPLFRVV